jgi:hypothetical protein
MQEKSIKKGVLKILQDGCWHGAEEFFSLGWWSFRNRISELRLEDGYSIISERQEGKSTYRYKLTKKGFALSPAPVIKNTPMKAEQITLF